MKIFVILFFMAFTLPALSQQIDTIRKDSAIKGMGSDIRSIPRHQKFLTVIDGRQYYRNSASAGSVNDDPAEDVSVEQSVTPSPC